MYRGSPAVLHRMAAPQALVRAQGAGAVGESSLRHLRHLHLVKLVHLPGFPDSRALSPAAPAETNAPVTGRPTSAPPVSVTRATSSPGTDTAELSLLMSKETRKHDAGR